MSLNMPGGYRARGHRHRLLALVQSLEVAGDGMPSQQLVQLHAGTVLHQRLGTHREKTVHRDHPPAVIWNMVCWASGGLSEQS